MSYTSAETKPIPDDLFALYVAFVNGRDAHRSGFCQTANIFQPVTRNHEDKLKSWAWDLGWREAAWIDQAPSRNAATGTRGATVGDRLREGRL
jgi:hypothetical protein